MPVKLDQTIPTEHGERVYVFRGRTGETVVLSTRNEGSQPGERFGIYRGDDRLGDVVGDPLGCATHIAEDMIGLRGKFVNAYRESYVGIGACGRPWEYALPTGVQVLDPEVADILEFLRSEKGVTTEVREGKIIVSRHHGM